MAIWKHKEWGEFEYEEEAFIGRIPIPAFEVFTFETGDPLDGTYEMTFPVYGDANTPSIEHVETIENLVKNQNVLAKLLVKSLWDDFNGIGPKSGMWWYGSLEDVLEDLEEGELNCAEDIYGLIQPYRFWFRDEFSQKKPILEIVFHAAFEEEHGLGMLTDGERILGSGYTMSVSPYES